MTDALIAEIARVHLGIDTLEPRNRDALDFHDLHVSAIRRALHVAYCAGTCAPCLRVAPSRGEGNPQTQERKQ